MSTELAFSSRQPVRQPLNPATGEVLTANSPPEDISAYIAVMREHKAEVNEAVRLASSWLIDYMDRSASWSIAVPGVGKVSAPSPQPVEEFDAPALRDALLALVDEGELTVEAVDKAVETTVTYHARKSGVSALRKRGGRVAEVVDAHCREVEKTRYVSVRPA